MNNFLLAMAGFIIAVFVAAFTVPYFLDWNDYRTTIEQKTSALVGREVRIDGDINLRLLPLPFLDLKKVRILDTFPGAKTPFVEVDTFTLWLSAPSLLSGNLEARKLELVRPVVNFVVDARGRGNWEEFQKQKNNQSSLPFQNIALQDVKIEQGKVVFHSLVNQGNKIFETPFLDGHMSAHSLSGPYKFRGKFKQDDDEPVIINFSTGRSSEKGMPVNAFMKSPITGATYQVISRFFAHNNGKMSYKGKLVAYIPFEKMLQTKKNFSLAKGVKKQEPLEIKADLEGSATRAKFNNVVFSLVRKNRPQALKGAVQLDWSHGDLQAVGNFNSRFLDVDLMGSGMGGGFDVSQLLATLPTNLYDLGKKFHQADFTLQLEQIQAGGEIIRNLETRLHKNKEEFKVTSLTARLPANSYLSLSGTIEKEAAKEATFAGPLSLQGTDLGRLRNWLAAQKDKIGSLTPFILSSQLLAGDGKIKLTEIEADLSGHVVHGEVIKESVHNESLLVRLDFLSMEIDQLVGQKMSFKELVAHFTSEDKKSFAIDGLGQLSFDDLANKKAKITVRIGALELTDTVLNDVSIMFDLLSKNNPVQQISFVSKEGLKTVIDGHLIGHSGKKDQKVNVRLESLKPSGVIFLAEYLELADRFSKGDTRLEMLHPLGINIGMVRKAQSNQHRILVNGQAGGSEIFAYGSIGLNETKKKGETFQDAQLDLKISIRNPDGRTLLKQFVTDLAGENMAAIPKGEGSLNVELLGMPSQGLQTEIYGALPGLKLTAHGEVMANKKRQNFSGPVSLEARNMSQGLALLGLGLQMRPNAGALVLKGQLEKKDSFYKFSDMHGKIGGSDIFGSATLDRSAAIPVLDLKVTSQHANLAALFEPGIDWFGSYKTQKVAQDNGVASLWTDRRFDMALLKRFRGRLALQTKEMAIHDGGLVLKDAALTASFGDGLFVIEKLVGKAYGGDVVASMTVKHGLAVSRVKGLIKVAGVNLEDIFPEHSNALATGKASFSLGFTGSGLSPRGIVNLVQGTGELQLIDTQFNYLSPSAIQQITAEELSGSREAGKSFDQSFFDYLSVGQFNAGTRRLSLLLQDGIISLDKAGFVDEQTALSVKSYISLNDLKLDSEWRLKTAKGVKPDNLPAVSLQFAGKLQDIGEIKPVYKIQNLKRFISVLKIEQDVQKLEAINSKLEAVAKSGQEERADLQSKRQQSEELGVLDSSSASSVQVETLEALPDPSF